MSSPRTRLPVLAAIALLAGSSGAHAAGVTEAGPPVLGVGTHPLTAVHASAWFITRSDSLAKELALLVYIIGPPGWTARDPKLEMNTTGNPASIRMVVGTLPIEILYDAPSRRATLSSHRHDVARDNVFVLTATGGDGPAVRGLGVHALTFPPDVIPALELAARDGTVREALAGPAPVASPRALSSTPAPLPPAEALALDAEGVRLLRSGAPGAAARACSLFARAAALGWAPSQYRYGMCLGDGAGFAPDASAANEWYRKAAGQGDANSAFKLGWSYRTGRGVPADPVAAFEWFRRCAALGDSICQALVAEAFEAGEGTPVHADSARAWFTRSAEHGVPPAQLALVRLAVESPAGDGVADAEAGLLWLDVLAAEATPQTDEQVERLATWRRTLEKRVPEPRRRDVRSRAEAWLVEHANRTIQGLAK